MPDDEKAVAGTHDFEMRVSEIRVFGELYNDAVSGGGLDQEEGSAVLDQKRRGRQ